MRFVSLAILSDIHYASSAEQARGDDYEIRALRNPVLRLLLKFHRRHIWLHEPLRKNYLLDQFISRVRDPDHVVANGDYSCNTAYVGVSDPAALESARECLDKLRNAYGSRFHAVLGDHELGKFSFLGKRGGMRLQSWHNAVEILKLEPFWQFGIGQYRLIGVSSPIIALPSYENETEAAERAQWHAIRQEHLNQVRQAFTGLEPQNKVLLFCHDPTALPWLAQERVIQTAVPQIEHTIIGHLHSNLVFRLSRMLAGMPHITFFGHTAKRLSSALRRAKAWRPFRVKLCPAVAGTELLKDGGFLTAEIDPEGQAPAQFAFHRLRRQ